MMALAREELQRQHLHKIDVPNVEAIHGLREIEPDSQSELDTAAYRRERSSSKLYLKEMCLVSRRLPMCRHGVSPSGSLENASSFSAKVGCSP
jgi:hypothetical protein